MEILFCHNHYQQHSGEDIAFDFAMRLLQENGHQISVFSRNNQEIRDFSAADKLLFPLRTLYAPDSRNQVERLARKQHPAVALVQNVFPLLSPSIYYGLADAGLPIVQMVFNYRLLCLNGLFFTNGDICERCIHGNYLHGVLRRCYRKSRALSAIYAGSIGVHRWIGTWRKLVTLFVTPDLFLKGKLVEGGIPAERIRVVSNPFDSSEWQPDYSLGSYALFVGRLIRAKGVFTLLEASLGLKGVHVVIVGDGEDVESVRSHPAIREGRAEYVGAVYGDRFTDLVQRAACVVVPSEWYDNLPMIVCQAFAMGKPVVASRINGIPEFVKHEENGLLFTTGSVAELRESIQRLCGDADLHARLSRNARGMAENVLSPKAWQENMNSVLNEAVRLNAPARP